MEAIESPVYDTLAIDAAGDYRAIDALVGEMARASEESLQPTLLIRRFYALHRSFYAKIIILTAEDTWTIDTEFAKEVRAEQRELAKMLVYLKKNIWFYGRLVWIWDKTLEKWSNYFAETVCCIIDGYGIDPKTNEIYFAEENPL